MCVCMCVCVWMQTLSTGRRPAVGASALVVRQSLNDEELVIWCVLLANILDCRSWLATLWYIHERTLFFNLSYFVFEILCFGSYETRSSSDYVHGSTVVHCCWWKQLEQHLSLTGSLHKIIIIVSVHSHQ